MKIKTPLTNIERIRDGIENTIPEIINVQSIILNIKKQFFKNYAKYLITKIIPYKILRNFEMGKNYYATL